MKRIAWAVGFSLAALVVWGCFGLTRHAIELMDAWKDAAPGDTRPIVANLTTASKSWADASKQQADSMAQIERDIRSNTWHIDRTLTTLDGTLSAYGGIPTHLNSAADAATGEIAALRGTTDQLTANLQHLTPVEDESRKAISHFDALLTSKDLTDAMHHTAGMTASGDKMLADAQWKEHQLLHPDKVKLGFWGSVYVAAKYVHQFTPPLF